MIPFQLDSHTIPDTSLNYKKPSSVLHSAPVSHHMFFFSRWQSYLWSHLCMKSIDFIFLCMFFVVVELSFIYRKADLSNFNRKKRISLRREIILLPFKMWCLLSTIICWLVWFLCPNKGFSVKLEIMRKEYLLFTAPCSTIECLNAFTFFNCKHECVEFWFYVINTKQHMILKWKEKYNMAWKNILTDKNTWVHLWQMRTAGLNFISGCHSTQK